MSCKVTVNYRKILNSPLHWSKDWQSLSLGFIAIFSNHNSGPVWEGSAQLCSCVWEPQPILCQHAGPAVYDVSVECLHHQWQKNHQYISLFCHLSKTFWMFNLGWKLSVKNWEILIHKPLCLRCPMWPLCWELRISTEVCHCNCIDSVSYSDVGSHVLT